MFFIYLFKKPLNPFPVHEKEMILILSNAPINQGQFCTDSELQNFF